MRILIARSVRRALSTGYRARVRELRAVEQRDAADEGRLEASGNAMVGTVIVSQGKVVRPSQLIASVGHT